MTTLILNTESIREAVYSRMDDGRSFAGRNAYFGASEEGRCSRRVVFDKVAPQAASARFSPASAHKVNLGRVLENEAVQYLRLAGVPLRETGQKQAEHCHPAFPYFRCHADGRILAGDLVLGDDAVGASEGDGALEVKSTSDFLLKRWIKEGLGLDYRSQANDQMGLRGFGWCLFVGTTREPVKEANLPPIGHAWILQFDPAMWEASQARVQVMEAARLAVEAAKSAAGGELDLDAIGAILPDGEPDRGYCASCLLAPTCQAYLNSAPDCPAGQDLPEDARLELEVILEELGQLEQDWKPLDKRMKDLKEQAKPLVPMNLPRKFVIDGGEATVIHKQISDLDVDRLVKSIQDLVATHVDDAAARDFLTLSILKAHQAETARKRLQAQLTLKPRRSA